MNRLRGVWGLIRVFAATGFRRRGRYWRWREETAFGRGRPGNRELTEAALDYGVWTLRMRHLGRARVNPHTPRGGRHPGRR